MDPAALANELSAIIQKRSKSFLPLSKKDDQAMAELLEGLAIAAENIQPGLWNKLATELSLIHSFVIDPLTLTALLATGLDPQAIGQENRQPIHAWALAVVLWSHHAVTENSRGARIRQALKIFLAAGVDINALDADGSTPLAVIASSPTSFCSDLLLAGADCSLPICHKKTKKNQNQPPMPILPIWAVLAKALLTFRHIDRQPRISSSITNFNCLQSRNEWNIAINLLRSQPSLDWALHGQLFFAEAFESAHVLSQATRYANLDPSWAEDLRSIGAWIASQGTSPSSLDFDGWPPLATSAAHGDIASVACLLKIGANTESIGPQGFTPLMAAAFNGHSEIVSMLLAAGSRIDALDRDGKSALDLAIAYGGSQCSMVLEIIELEALVPKASLAPRRRNAL